MCGIKYCVVLFALVLRTSISGEGKIVNEDEFGALCGMINFAKGALQRVEEAQEVNKSLTKIGSRCLELAGDVKLNNTCIDNNDESCEYSKVFWDAAKLSMSEGNAGKESLDDEKLEKVKQVASAAETIYGNMTKRHWVLNGDIIKQMLNRALYGIPHQPKKMRERSATRKRVCEEDVSQPEVNQGPVSLSRDLLCLCATDRKSRRKTKLCCENCVSGENRRVWRPRNDAQKRWNFLVSQCSNVEGHKEGFAKLVEKFRRSLNHRVDGCSGTMYVLGKHKKQLFWPLEFLSGYVPGPGVHYIINTRAGMVEDIPWLGELREIATLMGDSSEDNVEGRELKSAIEKLEGDLEELFPTGGVRRG
ncbi:variant surface glycoprotein (VSG)-related, putative [Trypanosoma brucei brucei TREU927]|uniref:Variant surface glycoprotein (VSG)-related, putative n=1 Tax=Trypanosoma brucei brucei (strain 927/4 GUTat10.1) TaxID=185431 RepID=Q57YT4_TRYB2|nr:variant surface glycoprotein (VSG)-related, putative [Trypanosoma brucei brucei TREU927]AAX69227.1 variant surface glycoprotein (VSG)-related, putative [Trypanosoma brucei]AAZ13495.1 variant surface glycoprotein (VSG)-related, putative [Trypanosoma brucei brucei TREU927]